jgi:dipeptidyl aminopeptidase/acylaminoacyl peptidase
VLFIDQPSPDAALGIWGVPLSPPSATPALLTRRIAFYTSDLSYVIEYGRNETALERLDGPLSETVVERWTLPAGGQSISISPGMSRVAWQVSNGDVPSERRISVVWVANFDGTEARAVATLPRGGLSGWISDDVLLLTGRESLESQETIVYTLALDDGDTVELLRANRPRDYRLSPDRRWLVYYITFSDDPAQNGLWLARADGAELRQLPPELFGAYQWRDARRLLIVPFVPEAVYHELWEYDVETGETRSLTDPGVTPFKIANGDWRVSPDGRYVAFVEDSDRNIWVLTLAE